MIKLMLHAFIYIAILFAFHPLALAVSETVIDLPVYDHVQNAERSSVPVVEARGAVLIDQDTGKVLFENNKDQRLFPASTTKILTALVAIENGNLNDMVTVGNEANMAPMGGTIAGLDLGEEISLRDLIRGLMAASGNDAGYTIAVHIGRGVSGDPSLEVQEALEVFIGLMNKRAVQSGALNSNFVNPHGFHHEDHYTTAYDLALIAGQAMEHSFFRSLVSTRRFEYPDWNGVDSENPANREIRYWVNRNRLLNPESEFYYPYATGIKTGWTTPAGPCLVSSATKDGLNLVSVVLNTTREGQWNDSRKLFEYGFSNFRFDQLLVSGQPMGSIPVENHAPAGPSEVTFIAENGFRDIFKITEIARIRQSIQWSYNCPEGNPRFVAPISKGQMMGVLEYKLDEAVLFQTKILADAYIEKRTPINTAVYKVQEYRPMLPYLQFVAGAAVIIVLIACAFIFVIKNRRGRRYVYRRRHQ